jgi:hypothetical protein
VTARAWLWLTAALTCSAFALAGSTTSAVPGRALAWLLFAGSSVHVASTGWLFTVPDVRSYAAARPARYLWVPAALIAAGAALAVALAPAVMTWLLLPFFAWQFFHFAKQNLGMVALAAASGRVPSLSRAERRVITAAALAGIAGLLVHPALLQLPVNPQLGVLFPVAGAAFGLTVLAGLAMLLRRPARNRTAGFTTMYLIALLFFVPIFFFSEPYAAVSGMTVAHGLQYLLLVGLVAAGGRTATATTAGRVTAVALLANIALIGGAALAGASHLHSGGPAERALFGAYLGVVMSHFVIDAGLWRLRDAFPRAFLTSRVPYLVGRS